MEQEKQKKSTFEKVVIVFNIIAVILMIITVINFGVEEKCTQPYDNTSRFNQKFTTFEGIRSGSQVKQLVETVNYNNAEYDGTKYVVSINGRTNENQYTCNVGSAKKYKVEIEKENGKVFNINIYNINGSTKDNTVDYTEFANITGYMQEGSVGKIENNVENEVEYIINWDIIILFIIICILYFALYIFSKLNKSKIMKKYNGEETQKKIYNVYIITLIGNLIISIIAILICLSIFNSNILTSNTNNVMAAKPIIYIYSEEETKVTVELGRKENLTCTYPLYEDKWEIIAEPDGTLIDEETGRTYYALYWEGVNSKKYSNKLEEGFVIKGEDTIKFLEEKLEMLGLNERESEEFIVYWLPKMQSNKYNYIRFQTIEEINENMPIEITPEPETLIRVMMEWKGLDKYVEVEEQQLEKVERKGYTVVEWGGTEIK